MAQLRRIYDSALVITPAINFIAEVYSRQSYSHVAPRAMCARGRESWDYRESEKKIRFIVALIIQAELRANVSLITKSCSSFLDISS